MCPCLHCCHTSESAAGLEKQQQLQLSANRGERGRELKSHVLDFRVQCVETVQHPNGSLHALFLMVENEFVLILFSVPIFFPTCSTENQSDIDH